MVRRRKCTECRKWFRPKVATAVRQKTCGERCRAERRRKLSRRRRLRDLDGYREDEKRRQRQRRAALRDGSTDRSVTCHVPPSDGNLRILNDILTEIWTKVASVSGATLQRELAKKHVQIGAFLARDGPPSRTTLHG